jgi:hypothetical protein
VLNRPYALMQWVQQVTIPEKYVLMSEPDHVWLRPMPNLMRGEHPGGLCGWVRSSSGCFWVGGRAGGCAV